MKQIIANFEIQLLHQTQKIQEYELRFNNSITKDKQNFVKKF